MILHGGCLSELATCKPESVDLIYLDSPFFTQKKHKSPALYEFDDVWDDINHYRQSHL